MKDLAITAKTIGLYALGAVIISGLLGGSNFDGALGLPEALAGAVGDGLKTAVESLANINVTVDRQKSNNVTPSQQ